MNARRPGPRGAPYRFTPLTLRQAELQPNELPIYPRKREILNIIGSSRISIIQGSPGCGKTTQVPKYILEETPDAYIVVTQPRRLPAISAAKRVAFELGGRVGGKVGYHIHGERNYSTETKVMFMTIGLFIQELVSVAGSGELPWSHIIIDEVHERTLETDFVLVVLKEVLKNKRSRAKLILMSATINSAIFANYFSEEEMTKTNAVVITPQEGIHLAWSSTAERQWLQNACPYAENTYHLPAPIVSAGGKVHKVKKMYLDEIIAMCQGDSVPDPDLSQERLMPIFSGSGETKVSEVDQRLYDVAALIIKKQHTMKLLTEENDAKLGTFLVFLPGMHEINSMSDALTDAFQDQRENLEMIPLHSAVPEVEHLRILDDPQPGVRRVIISTNIAESSVTIKDVRIVMDFGYTKEVFYNSTTYTEALQLCWAAKAALKQRAGRAGRVAEGLVVRLMPKEFYKARLAKFAKPEIQRCPLDKLILKVKQLGLGSAIQILGQTLEPPQHSEVVKTEQYLAQMGAITDDGQLAWLGVVYADMPCNIKLTRLAIFGALFRCGRQALNMAAILAQERSPFLTFSTRPPPAGRQEYRVYQKRLMWDDYADSDPICLLHLYNYWYSHFGKFLKLRLRGQTTVRKVEATIEERKWATANYINCNILREIMVTGQELKKRLLQLGVKDRHLKSTVDLRSTLQDVKGTSLLVLKLCLAGAFVGKYMISDYYLQDTPRKNVEGTVRDDPENAVLIDGIPDFLLPEDIQRMLEDYCLTSNINVTLTSSQALVRFLNPQPLRPIQLAMWVGQLPQRYRQGLYTVIKRTKRKPNGDLVDHYPLGYDHWTRLLNLLPRFQRKDKTTFKFDAEELTQTEVHCLARPDYLFALQFYDVTTQIPVAVEEDSVNFVAVETDVAMAKKRFGVAADFVEKNKVGKTYARMVTLFPNIPLLPHILSLVFASNVSLEKDKEGIRYGGVRLSESHPALPFDYEFSTKDVEDINSLREEISTTVREPKILSTDVAFNMVDRLIQLLRKPRLPVMPELARWTRLLQDGVQPTKLRRRGAQRSKAEGGFYLKSLDKLDVDEDPSLDNSDWEAQRTQSLESYRRKKQEIIEDLNARARNIFQKQAELICRECKMTLCVTSNIKYYQPGGGLPVFTINGIFGTVLTLAPLDLAVPTDFTSSYERKYTGQPDLWATCHNGHILGWVKGSAYLVDDDSPVAILFPTLIEAPWTALLWHDDFRKLKLMNAGYQQERESMQIDKSCGICALEFPEERSFGLHVTVSKEHKDMIRRFLSDFAL